MREYISWLEHIQTKEIKFLTADNIFKTKRGQKLRKYTFNKIDLIGPQSILWYFDLNYKDWCQRTCTDFSSPDNFPALIAAAIRLGKMNLTSIITNFPQGLLKDDIYHDYIVKHEAISVEYLSKFKSLYQKYASKHKVFDDRFIAKCRPLDSVYWAKYRRLSNAQWEFFVNPDNRMNVWR